MDKKPDITLGDIIKRAEEVSPVDLSQVDHPSHYNQGKIECIEALRECLTPEEFRGFLKGNTIKYLWRLNGKGKPKEDAEKGRWYLDQLIGELGKPSR